MRSTYAVLRALAVLLGAAGPTPRKEDPLLTFVGRGRLRQGDWALRKDWRD